MKPKKLAETLKGNIEAPYDQTIDGSPESKHAINELGAALESLFHRIGALPEEFKKRLEDDEYDREYAFVYNTQLLDRRPCQSPEWGDGIYTKYGWSAYFEIPLSEDVLQEAFTPEQMKVQPKVIEVISIGFIKTVWGEFKNSPGSTTYDVMSTTKLEQLIYTDQDGEMEAGKENGEGTDEDLETQIKADQLDETVNDAIISFKVVETTNPYSLDDFDEYEFLLDPNDEDPHDSEQDRLARLLAIQRHRQLPFEKIIESFDLERLEVIVSQLEQEATAFVSQV